MNLFSTKKFYFAYIIFDYTTDINDRYSLSICDWILILGIYILHRESRDILKRTSY